MFLRNLRLDDAVHMLEWMHDDEVTRFMKRDFNSMAIEDCEKFIINSNKIKNDLHLAIVDKNDEYLGTVSLKNIDSSRKIAEFAITIRRCAMGKGYASQAMKEIFLLGKNKYGLRKIYWYVSKDNTRAIRFYDKNMYQRNYESIEGVEDSFTEKSEYIWYVDEI